MIEVVVTSRTTEAQDICSYELASVDGNPLPPFSAGAHIDVHLPDGLIRQYSLCNHPEERHRYLIGVLKDPASRGGSNSLHAQVHAGTRLTISEPRNLFPPGPRSTAQLAVCRRHRHHPDPVHGRTPGPDGRRLRTALLRPRQ